MRPTTVDKIDQMLSEPPVSYQNATKEVETALEDAATHDSDGQTLPGLAVPRASSDVSVCQSMKTDPERTLLRQALKAPRHRKSAQLRDTPGSR